MWSGLSYYLFNSNLSYYICRPNPQNTNEAILSWGDTGGFVNAIQFNSATIALFERPPAPAGEKQGNSLIILLITTLYYETLTIKMWGIE